MIFDVLLIAEEEGGFSGLVSNLPGCVSQGESKDETLRNVTAAIMDYLEARGDPVAEVQLSYLICNG